MGKVYVVGIGPGSYDMMTIGAVRTLEQCDMIAGYKTYVDLIAQYFPGKEWISTGMKQETERCRAAVEKAAEGHTVAVISSGDAGVYGMAGLVYEVAEQLARERAEDAAAQNPEPVEIEVIPGVTAASSGAAVLGAPLIHDFAVISLSDLLTPWEKIEQRLLAAAEADLCIVLYNPSSHKRADYLQKACDLILRYAAKDRVCGVVENIGREGTCCKIMTLQELRDTSVNMFTTVFIGNQSTKVLDGHMVTPRGYKI